MGGFVDAKLYWKPHISYLTSPLMQSVGVIYKIRQFPSKDFLKIL